MFTTDSLIIGFDFSHGVDRSVLIVGRKKLNQAVEVINAFQGKEAEDIYKMLTTKKEKEK
jgi:hypothetical protein